MKKHVVLLAASLVAVGQLLAQTTQAPAKKKDDAPVPSGSQTDGPFRKVILEADTQADGKFIDSLKDPMELAVAPDGRVFYAQRDGTVKMIKPGAKEGIVIAKLDVFTGLEDGMLGITLDPNFEKNNWVYLNRSMPPTTTNAVTGGKAGIIRVARFTLAGEKLDLASEKTIIEIPTQREQCCHVGGSIAFDGKGNLLVAVGDNTNPFDSDGFSPSDSRPGRSPWDAQKSSANPNALTGKVLRVTPKIEGGYDIPSGNLFKPGTAGTRPEIYAMGTRNSFRVSADQKTGYVYWGDVGPDAGGPSEKRGPAGFDEINQARTAGFFGWPYFVADNKPYAKIDFAARADNKKAKEAYDKAVKAKEAYDKAVKEKKTPLSLPLPLPPKPTDWLASGEPQLYDALKPVNDSANNTGLRQLPSAQPAFIYYPPGQSTRFPAVGSGGRTAMAGPVYYFDEKLQSPHKLPKEFDRTLFIYEWSRNWIISVKLDENHNIAKKADGSPAMERFCPNMTFKRPMDLELGADGCLYLIEFGTAWGNNKDTQIVRIEHTGVATTAVK